MVGVWESIHYKPGFYDPASIDWIITAAYFVAAALCFRTASTVRKLKLISAKPASYMVWFCLAGLMSILGVNKQLDLIQTVTISAIQGIENENGWSGSGRLAFQTAFVVLVVLIAVILFFGLLWMSRKNWRQYGLALCGLALVFGFLAIRTSSINQVDYPLSRWSVIGHVRMKYVVELTGAILVGAGAYFGKIRCKP